MISVTSGSARYGSIGPYPSTSSVICATRCSRSALLSGTFSAWSRALSSRTTSVWSWVAVSDASKRPGPSLSTSARWVRRLSFASGPDIVESATSLCAFPASETVDDGGGAASPWRCLTRSPSFTGRPDASGAAWVRAASTAPAGAGAASWVIANDTGDRGSDSMSGTPWFSETGTERELGIATSTLTPTALSIELMVNPVRASARLSTKCHCCAGRPMTLSASTSLRVLRTLGTSVAESNTMSVVCSSAVRVASSRPEGVSMSTYLKDSTSSWSTRSTRALSRSSASVGVAGAHSTKKPFG